MKTKNLSNEKTIKEGPANLHRNLEAVGGKLFLTNNRLIFESHKFNIQTGTTIIPLENISGIQSGWSKLLYFIPVVPNKLTISTIDSQEHSFVLFGRNAWLTAIKEIWPNPSPRGRSLLIDLGRS
jgi:hypothetical protein